MAAQGFEFHREVIRRNESYKDHFKLIVLLRKKSINHTDFWRLDEKVIKFYSIPKGKRGQNLIVLKKALRRKLLSAWGLHRLDDFPEPFELENSKASKAPKRYKIFSVHKKVKSGEKGFNSILKQLEEEYESGTRMFICIRPGCTKEDLDSIRWDNHANKAYGKNALRKTDPERDLWIWDTITNAKKNKKSSLNKICLSIQPELKDKFDISLSIDAVAQAYYRTSGAISSSTPKL